MFGVVGANGHSPLRRLYLNRAIALITDLEMFFIIAYIAIVENEPQNHLIEIEPKLNQVRELIRVPQPP